MSKKESRTYKSLKNIRVDIFFFLIGILLSFFSRKIFIEYLGSEVVGLNSTIGSLIGFLSVAELGISWIISYSLYKPMRDNDSKTISEIISIQAYFYRKIGCFILTCSIILALFFPIIFAKANVVKYYPYLTLAVMLFSSLIGYFFNYRSILFFVDQKNYKLTYIFEGILRLKVLAQIILLFYIRSNAYVYWLLIEFLSSIIMAVLLHFEVEKEYPTIKIDFTAAKGLITKYKEIFNKIKQVFVHKISSVIVTHLSPLIVYSFFNLTLVTIYTNYVIITGILNRFMEMVSNSIYSSIGNLTTENDIKKEKIIFYKYLSIRFFISSILIWGFSTFVNPFISLWFGKQYILNDSSVYLFSAVLFVSLTRGVVDSFLSIKGLFHDIWAPITEASINLSLSFLLGYFFGVNGILIGTLISFILIVVLWKPFFLATETKIIKLSEYFFSYFFYILLLISSSYLYQCFHYSQVYIESTLFNFIIDVAIQTIQYISLLFILYLFFDKHFRILLKHIFAYVRR
ncbi:sugar transporter [Mergibacter septicus]|uniref:hypothetical protein n=1 Tax=Mergibacter septicus TaxID=221402 RepID=UPI001179372A|nr:hypothetical protein [Mergibacter septicus]AWX13210.1 sugar transporter [Mergibacter septicus]